MTLLIILLSSLFVLAGISPLLISDETSEIVMLEQP